MGAEASGAETDRQWSQDTALAADAAEWMRAAAEKIMGDKATPGRVCLAALMVACMAAREAGMKLRVWNLLVKWIRSSLPSDG